VKVVINMKKIVCCSVVRSSLFTSCRKTRISRVFNNRRTFTSTRNYDVAIIGGGIVGLATAQELISRQPKLKYIVLEKENKLALHQTGHNSGVIHAGIYYKPGTLKAKLCVQGLEMTYKYCDEHGIPYKKCGKLIVAVTNDEVPRLEDLYQRGIMNGVEGLTFLSRKELKEVEPHCEGKIALFSPNTGIVDWGQVARKFGEVFTKQGGEIKTGYEVTEFKKVLTESSIETEQENKTYPIRISGKNQEPVQCCYALTCAGLQSDRIAEMTGCSSEPKIVPFRGEYLVLKPEKQYLVKGNIYPVPDPSLPFLGVHFTPRMDGGVWLGPNALLAFKREGYKFWDLSISDLADSLSSGGLRKLIGKNLMFGIGEFRRSFDLHAQIKQLQKYIPEIRVEDVDRGPSGVRAQALDRDGNLVDDFVFDISKNDDVGKRVLHVRNAPSPAATSSLAIARMIADKVQTQFDL